MKKIKVPDRIKIGGHVYCIRYGGKRMLDENTYGEVNHRLATIDINPTRPSSQKREAFIHEILHCIDRVYCNSNSSEDYLGDLSEGLNQALDELGIDFDWRDIQKHKGKK